MVQVSVSLTYCLLIPQLVGIALIGLTIFFLLEHYLLAYYYQRPFKTDMRLYKFALRQLSFIPIPMLLLGFWMLGNRQFFYN